MLLPFDPIARREEVATVPHLAQLADGLALELEPLLNASTLPIPDTKARLTRQGGRCPVHGTLLTFDPWSPRSHHCPACGTSYTDETHHAWWAMGAQLYVVERAVHAASLALLRHEPRHRELARQILAELAARYTTWPNRDNVLGPTRPFFSTYLESIWLLNACHATALLEAAGPFPEAQVVRDQLLAPSSALIAGYHEGRSNRQVWNEVAILSAWTLLGEHARCERRIESRGSLLQLITEGLLDDGTWYEGENYHLFAHRGLWYGAQWLRACGRALPPVLDARMHLGFLAPFTGLLPDETLPSRRDAQYRISVRQWRIAEHLELGFAHTPDGRIAGLLHRLYDGTVTRRSDARASSTADAERNEPAMALSRADGSWRALLMASAADLPAASWRPTSLVQPAQGVAILRRESAHVYVALEGGETGGGHGHPDRLALTLQIDESRWLDDPGTGSYVESTLHWYRSTIAHHAPLFDGASQQRVPASLVAFEERDGAGWICKRVDGIAPGVRCVRTIIVCDGYLVDQLDWQTERSIRVSLPIAAAMALDGSGDAMWTPSTMHLKDGLEDGAPFVRDVEQWSPEGNAHDWAASVPPVIGGQRARTMRWWGHVQSHDASSPPRLLRAMVPGAPGLPSVQRHVIEAQGRTGSIRSVWSWSRNPEAAPMVTAVQWLDDGAAVVAVTTDDGTTATHEPAPHGWHIALTARHARSSIDLQGLSAAVPANGTRWDAPAPDVQLEEPIESYRILPWSTQHASTWTLAAEHYVPTEEPWGGGNAPRATIHGTLSATHLVLDLAVWTGHALTSLGGDLSPMPDNPLDNERADINADGVQLYVGREHGAWRYGVLCAPLPAGSVRMTPLHGEGGATHAFPMPEVAAHNDRDGWRLTLRWARCDLDALCEWQDGQRVLPFDLIVNERPPERERRRGQLVLSGGGSFGYLRGDRHAPTQPVALSWPSTEPPA